MEKKYDSKIDVWSLGLLAYELIVGRVPFKIWSEFDLHIILEHEVVMPDYIDCTDNLKDFVTKCLVKDQAERSGLTKLRYHEFMLQGKDSYINMELVKEIDRLFMI